MEIKLGNDMVDHLVFRVLFVITFGFTIQYSVAQNVGIGTTPFIPASSAILELQSTTKGFLTTRNDTTNITAPVLGLMTVQTTDSCLYIHNGTKWQAIGGAGCCCPINGKVATGEYATGTVHCTKAVVKNVFNPATGKTWMDRNLGASQVAAAKNDALAYGDLYQWGRLADGHQCRTSTTSPNGTESNIDVPAVLANNFYRHSTSPFDWRNPQNKNLWLDLTGINNPCPSGYRIPTSAELNAERMSWSAQSATGAFASPLKLPAGGRRAYNSGSITLAGTTGYYWSSTTDGLKTKTTAGSCFKNAVRLTTSGSVGCAQRAEGCAVRCIKDHN